MSRRPSSGVVEAYERYRSYFFADGLLRARHAGGAYPRQPAAIDAMIAEHFDRGIGPLDGFEGNVAAGAAGVPGLVVPHLDLRVGGPVFSFGYAPLLTAPAAKTFVILGVGHKCPADLSLLCCGYETPLGPVHCDEALAHRLVKAYPGPLEVEPMSHVGEHSIEFAVVYLQALARRFPHLADFKIVPILLGGMHRELVKGTPAGSPYDTFARVLGDVVGDASGRVCLIGSVDGSHVGPRFDHDFEVDEALLEKIEGADREAFAAAVTGDPNRFFQTFVPTVNARHFDGVGVIYTMLAALQGRARFELLAYDQWFEESDRSVVSLASGVFRPVR